MFSLIKKMFILFLASTANSLNCISLKHQECKVVVNNKYMSFPYKINVNRCIGSCNNINNPYSKVRIPDIIKNVIVKMLDLINLENTTRPIEFHESCKCVCKINKSVCSEKQKFNKNKCRCECLINKKCQDDFVWNYSSCECEFKTKR